MKQFYNVITWLIIALCLVNCSGTPSPLVADQSSATDNVNNTESQELFIGHIAAIPVVNGGFLQTNAIVTNNSSNNLQLKSYTIESALAQVNNPDTFVDAGQCSSLPANASCTIIVKGNASLASFIVTLYFSDPSGKTYQVSQLINYVNSVGRNTGGFYIDNSHITVVLPQKYTTIVIPYVLAANYTNVTVSTGTTNAVAYPVCDNKYAVNSRCSTFVKIKANGGTYNFNLIINGSQSGSSTGSVVSIPVTVTSNPVADLVTAPVVYLSESSPSVNSIIFNDGLSTATGFNDSAAISISAYANNTNINSVTKCSQIIPGTGCPMLINATKIIQNDVLATMQINYNNSVQNMTTSFLLDYTASLQTAVSPDLSVSLSSQNAFNYVTVNPAAPYGPLVISITNTGNTPLNNLAFSDLSVQDSALQLVGSGSSCQNGQSLAVGQSCALSYTYNPGSVETKMLSLSVSANYTNSSGQIVVYTSCPVNILVNAVQGLASLVTIFMPDTLTINADGKSTVQFEVITTNTGPIPATNVKFNYMLPAMVEMTANSCAGLTNIEPYASCKATYQFGPTSSAMSESYPIESISYYAAPAGTNGQTMLTNGNDNKILLNAILGATIIVENVTPLQDVLDGNGTESAPWGFYNSGSKALQLEITYKNIGAESAESFNVGVANLPTGVMVDDSSTCGNGSATYKGFVSVLAPGSVCTIILDEVANAGTVPGQPWNYQYFSGPINIPLPGVSYWDASSGVHKITPGWNAVYTLYTYAQTLIDLIFTAGSVTLDPVSAQYKYPVTVTNNGPKNLTGLTFATSGGQNTSLSGTTQIQDECNMSVAPGQSCQVTLASAVGMTQPGYSYSFNFYYSVAGYSGEFTGYTNFIIPAVNAY